MAVYCHNLPLEVFSGRIVLSVLDGALFAIFGLFYNSRHIFKFQVIETAVDETIYTESNLILTLKEFKLCSRQL